MNGVAEPSPVVAQNRACVFCGQQPKDKNKEHILPQWLLELTGDPNRVVKFGIDYSKGKIIEFSWNGLVVPACSSCNSSYGSGLEASVKPIVVSLLARKPVTVQEFLVLLDWLDKVRIGLWLNYKLIQKIPYGAKPNFRIDDRIGKKDRMVAVYTIDAQEKGLNAFGVESFLFHSTPSCFALKINNIILANMSADYLFAGNCGFPAPRTRKLLLEGPNAGKTLLENVSATYTTADKLLNTAIIKPTIQIYQPILQKDAAQAGGFIGVRQVDSYLAQHTFGNTGRGICFRQFDERAEPLAHVDNLVEFDEVTGTDCAPLAHIIAQVYEHQIWIQSLYSAAAKDKKMLSRYRRSIKFEVTQNREIAAHYRSLVA